MGWGFGAGMRRLALALCFGGATAAAEVGTLEGHGGPIMGIATAPDGRVATASFDNAVGLWTDGVPVWLDGHEAATTAVAFAPDGSVLSGGDDFAVMRWRDGVAEVLGRHLGKVTALAVAPDGATLASASWDGTVGLWPLDGGAGEASVELGAGVNAVAFAPDGAALFAGTTDGSLWRRDTETGEARALVRAGFGVNEVIAGDGWLAYGAVDGVTRVVDAEDGSALADFTLDRRPILAMAHHPGTAALAVGDGDGWIMVLDTRTWTVAQDFRATQRGPVWALAFASDGATLYAGGLDDAAYAWPMTGLDDAAPGHLGRAGVPARPRDDGERGAAVRPQVLGLPRPRARAVPARGSDAARAVRAPIRDRRGVYLFRRAGGRRGGVGRGERERALRGGAGAFRAGLEDADAGDRGGAGQGGPDRLPAARDGGDRMKAMIAGFVVMAALAVGAWFVLNDTLDYTEAERTGPSVRLD